MDEETPTISQQHDLEDSLGIQAVVQQLSIWPETPAAMLTSGLSLAFAEDNARFVWLSPATSYSAHSLFTKFRLANKYSVMLVAWRESDAIRSYSQAKLIATSHDTTAR